MTYDYIIIGAGSAGSILAARLSQDPKTRVLLLEAGGSDRSFWFDIPAGYARNYFNPETNWMYSTEPEAGMAGRKIYTPRGKVQGGSGSINAMIWVRGQRQDFDDWKAAGNPGWGYDDVLPWFRKLEQHPAGETEWHGASGPVGITPMKGQTHPICDHFLQAARELDLPLSDDFNGADFEGAGIYETNIARGKRQSSSKTYLTPALKRPNLTLRLRAEVTRILIDDTGRATGVELQTPDGPEQLSAAREVILSAGAVGSPKLLMLSGIGDPEELARHGIALRAALPAVGQGLQDHLCASYYYRSTLPTLNDELRPWWGKLRAGMRYLLARSGPLALSVNQAGGFFRTASAVDAPNIQLYFNPMSYRIPPSVKAKLEPEPYPGFLLAFNACRPQSRGRISLASADPRAAPLIRPNYLATERDQREVIEASRLIRRFMQAPALKAITVEEVSPGLQTASDSEMLDYLREQGGSIYHLCGSCTMGPDPSRAVVDAELRVHGIRGLRVADASVFPNITSGNINAPVMMLAEKAAAMISASAR
ncbi:GMC family oxidoreductase [Pseudogemmobacter faecipullorum]|uniref:GMC family oxidoreductase N-terminal domain-containing protein n=1 Tax=Pseudogemmobacter faecipullorum TaxID=2755041 RepID=A0ABS8CM46_9RHOB|nr:GMC family oxidoreductase N-terminal domain-containing protein [Pseudogemmobacter faecipullorum]MCB5410462.1 GMC family oxidoreductase N-terminal domain-containing protein [Pseudogemmobacter faecipullorum]